MTYSENLVKLEEFIKKMPGMISFAQNQASAGEFVASFLHDLYCIIWFPVLKGGTVIINETKNFPLHDHKNAYVEIHTEVFNDKIQRYTLSLRISKFHPIIEIILEPSKETNRNPSLVTVTISATPGNYHDFSIDTSVDGEPKISDISDTTEAIELLIVWFLKNLKF